MVTIAIMLFIPPYEFFLYLYDWVLKMRVRTDSDLRKACQFMRGSFWTISKHTEWLEMGA